MVQTALHYIQARAWLNGLIQFSIALILLYAFYVYVMSKAGGWLRERIPFLNYIFGEIQIRSLINAQEFARAGDRLLALGQLDHAAEVYQKGQLYGRAADVYLKKKKPEKAAQLYERAGEFMKAAELYLDLKMFVPAEMALQKGEKLDEFPKLLERRGALDFAILAYKKSGELDDAARLLIQNNRAKEAAELYLKLREENKKEEIPSMIKGAVLTSEKYALKAADIFENHGNPKKAGDLFFEIGKPADAARCFQKSGDIFRAVEIYEQIGDLKKASELLAKTGEKTSSQRLEAEHLFQNGQLALAADLFAASGDFVRAAELHRDLGQLETAADLYEKGNEFSLAGSLYRELKSFKKAALAYEKEEDWAQAAECYGKAGLPEKQLGLLKKAGDVVSYAKALHKAGRLDDALKALTELDMNDDRMQTAISLKGKIFLDQGKTLEAKELLEKAISKVERLSGDDIDNIYNLALLSEQTQTKTNAMQILEKMMAQGLVEKSFVSKAENVRKILSERAFTRMSALPGGGTSSRMFAASDAALTNNDTTQVSSQRYQVKNEIGRGGMGVVYLTKDRTLDRTVALKVLHSSFKKNEQAVQTFLREGKSAAGLNHPNIVTIFDAGTQDGEYYIAMELLEGKTLKQIIKAKGKFSPGNISEILKQLLSGMAYAHDQKIVHRDLSNNNIMWTQQKTIKIMDFGLAKIVRELASEQSIVGGTPSYMSPEQTLGNPIDHRTDIYSLGICIYEMALGELPYLTGDMGFHHLHTPPPIPQKKDPTLSLLLNKIILKCLEKKPEERFQSAHEILALLKQGL